MDLVALVASIPATFWGVIIGSLFTVIGVTITNTSNTRRLRLQHEHERALDARTRDLNMRREVYLGAFEAIATGMSMVGNFSELEVPYQELMRAFMGKSGAIGKVTMVGREETIQAVTGFEQALTRAFIQLSMQRSAVDQQYQQARSLSEKIERSLAEQERLVAAIEREDDASDPAVLARSLDHERQRTEALRAKVAEIDAVMVPAVQQLVAASMRAVGELNLLLAPVIRQVRAELGLSFDEAFFVELVEEGHAQLMANMQAVLDGMSASPPGADATPEGDRASASR